MHGIFQLSGGFLELQRDGLVLVYQFSYILDSHNLYFMGVKLRKLISNLLHGQYFLKFVH